MKKILIILLLGILACEEQVEVPLPKPENLVVIEGFITDSLQTQEIRISRSLPFAANATLNPLENAEVVVETDSGMSFVFSHDGGGIYRSVNAFRGMVGSSYKLAVTIGTRSIESTWDQMPSAISELELEISSFLENDPESNNEITVYYPKVTALDPQNVENYYRWILRKNGVLFNSPEPITIQDDRFFDGNLIPNNFQNFDYKAGDQMEVELLSISRQTYEFLNLLRSQITTLGRSSGTTPAIVEGNLKYIDGEGLVLGYFGTASIQAASIQVP